MSATTERTFSELDRDLSSQRVDTLLLLVRHRRLLTATTLAAAVVACAISFFLPATYVATVRLLPPQQTQSPAALFFGPSATSPLAVMAQKELGLKNPTDLYVGLLNSRSIQDALVQRFQLGQVYGKLKLSDVREELAAHTRVQVTKDGLITVAVEDRDAVRSAALANAYADSLRATTKRLAMSEATQRHDFYNQQVLQAREELDRAESSLSAVQEKTGVLQIDAQSRALIDSAASLRSQIASGEVQLHALRTIGTDANPEVRQAIARLDGWRSQLTQLESRQSADPAFSKGRAPMQAQEYMRALREVQYQRAVLDVLLRQSEAAKLDEAREATIIQVVDLAVPPDTRSSPKRAAIVVLAAVATLLAVICALRWHQRFCLTPAWQVRWAELRQEWRP